MWISNDKKNIHIRRITRNRLCRIAMTSIEEGGNTIGYVFLR